MSERRVKVQGDLYAGHPRHPDAIVPGTIAWWEHVQAWREYARNYSSSQSAEDIAARGGFGYGELQRFLGHDPVTWQPRAREMRR